MAGWSIFSDGSNRSASDYFEILKSLKSNGFCLDLDVTSLTMGFDGSKDGNKFRFLFDKLLSVYLNEVAITEALRPLPVILGNGEHVDLFKLFWVVRENGGFDSVSKNNLWGSVMEACALGGSGFLPAIKLVYVKYLHTFDQLVRGGLKGNGITNGLGMSDCGKNLDLSTDMLDQAKIVEKPNELSSTKDESQMPVLNMHDAALPVGEKKVDIDDDEVMILDPSEANENVESRKRKRETLLGMLDWVTEIAKNPGDPGVENLMFQLEQKESRSKEFQGLVLSARNTLHQGPNFYLSKDSSIAQVYANSYHFKVE
ncbi:hypothetical protein GIB67_037272 [Kingdonia uniflora]|uniref:ARID domain-containing protein n=1 Tax=Kingdonia uniflora TaxID=39325 RepID=A0A7J7MRX9_9MAGN|nr:hypothetical protein GIB67_037272 [Kingdonia uniflora]